MTRIATKMCCRVHIALGSRFFLISFKIEFWEKNQGAFLIPEIAIAIGVLTSNRGEGDEPV